MNKKILISVVVLAAIIIANTLFALQSSSRNQKETNNTLSSEWANSKNDLKNVKSAVLYESVTEGPPVGVERSTGEIINLFKETRADIVFRGFWRWLPVPDSPDNISPVLASYFAERAKIAPEQVPLLIEKSGHNYAELEKRIKAIKKEKPGIIFVGAIPAQRINQIEKNDVTGKIYGANETWAMALDPQKWNIHKNGKPFTKMEFQAQFANWHGWAESGQYDPNKVEAYFPDITNPEYQELLLSWAYRQIDAGADAIWIDGLPQTPLLYPFINGVKHPAIKDFYEASQKIIDGIHNYGESKGKRIYVGSWGIPLKFAENMPYLPLNIDFVTITPIEKEIQEKRVNESYEKIKNIRKIYGNTPIFVFIDWGVDESPTVVFSQRLSSEEQKKLLGVLDEYFAKNGVNFVYPVHGGYMGRGAVTTRFAFGKYMNYDSLAPEFGTYDTIKGLARKKSANEFVQSRTLNAPYAGQHENLLEVKVATLYEKVTDRELVGGRSLDETINVLKQTNTDFIFRGFWVWNGPTPESPDNIPPEMASLFVERLKIKPEGVPEFIRRSGLSYQELRNSISTIKKEMPGVIFVGAVPAQTIGRIEINPITGKVFNAEDTWKMAFDPQKWGVNYMRDGRQMDKEEFQKITASANQEMSASESYDWRKARGYFPDITNPDFQELFLSWAKKQIDSGADAIWIDLLYSQANVLKGMTGDVNHPAVKESYDAASKMVDEIHKYGEPKGRYIYVGTWSEPVIDYPWAPPRLDFVTDTPTPQEIYYGKFDEARWSGLETRIKNKFGSIPHFAFIDWGGRPDAPTDVFSQQLGKEQQKEFLRKADDFFMNKGIVFIYPVHGADFWGDAKMRAFGKFTKYDSLAPEFDTFGTIKELAQSKKGE